MEIRDGAFDSCVRLSSITLPKSLRTLGDAFRGCMELKTVKVSPENPSFKSVDGVLYSRDMETLLVYPPARAASEFTVPETVRRGWHLPVFSQKLQTLTIPAGVEPVADFIPVDLEQTVYFKGSAEEWCNLFRGASQFPRVRLVRESADIRYEGDYGYTVENGQATLRSYTGTDTDLNLPDMLGGCPVTAVGEEALCFLSGLNWEANEQGETEGRCRTYRVTVPEGVISLGDRAFYGSNLVSVFLPATLTELGAQVFAFCDQLENISVAAENPCFAAGDGALYSRDGTTLYVLCGRTRQEGETESVRRTGFILPSAVTAIAPGAFLSCPELDAVGVEAGSAAFAGADGVLTDLHGKTLAAYPAGALQRQIPETVETVGAYAFARSEMPDRTAYLLGNVTELGEGAFAYCKIGTVTIPEGIENIPERAFFGSSLAELHLPAGLTSIGEDAFCFCASLETVYFGGTESEWREISMASGNEALEHAHVEFESP